MHQLRSKPLPRAEAEALADRLSEADAPEALSVASTEVDEAAGLWRVEAHYEEEPDAAALAALGLDPGRIVVEPLPDEDWVARSLAGLAPVVAGRFRVHGRHHRGGLPPGGVAVEIEAGTAFGTGHHATTAACLIAIDRHLKRRRPRRVLDVGCGSGILAIAAARAARRPATGTDIDPEAVRVTLENARLNGVGGLVRAELARPGRIAAGRHGLVLANILARPLVALSAQLARALDRDGELVLSGLLRDQEREVLGAHLAKGLVLRARIRIGAWSALVLGPGRLAPRKGAPGTGRECRAQRHQSGRRGLVRISGRSNPRPSAGSHSA